MMIMFIIIIFIFIIFRKKSVLPEGQKDTTSGVKSGGVTEAAGGRSCGRKVEVPVFFFLKEGAKNAKDRKCGKGNAKTPSHR